MGQLIALCGEKGAGKDTVAGVVFPDYLRFAFADRLKEEILGCWGDLLLPDGRCLVEAVNESGWEELKRNPVTRFCIRKALQDFGTLRRNENENYWVDALLRKLPLGTPVIVTDARLPNEILAVRERSGLLIRVSRSVDEILDGTEKHVTEQAWKTFTPDFVIHNNGSLEDLARSVDELRMRIGIPALSSSHA